MKPFCPLSGLTIGQRGTVCSLPSQGTMRRRLLELGMTEGATVECLCRSLAGDPAAYRICGAVVALRRETSDGVCVRPLNGGDAAWV